MYRRVWVRMEYVRNPDTDIGHSLPVLANGRWESADDQVSLSTNLINWDTACLVDCETAASIA